MDGRSICRLAWMLALLLATACSSKTEAPSGKAGKDGKNGGRPPVPVLVARAERADVPVELKAMGTVEALQSSVVRSQVTGTVTEIGFREGDVVRSGQLLFRIDPRPFEAALQQLQANLARDGAQAKRAEAQVRNVEAQVRSAEAQARNAEAQARRYEELILKDFVTREQVDQRRAAADAAAAGVDSARAAVEASRAAVEAARSSEAATRAAIENARVQLGYTTIRSPVTGRTGSLAVKQGDLVKANDAALVTVNQLQPILVRFALPESSLAAVRRYERQGTLRVHAAPSGDGGEPRAGRVVFVDNAVDPGTGTIALKARFDNADGVLWPGQFTDVRLALYTLKGAVVIPAAAVQTGQQGSYVFVVGPEGAAAVRPVVPGAAAGERVVVERGIEAGETVVTDGHLKLTPGARVVVKEGLGLGVAETQGRPEAAGKAL